MNFTKINGLWNSQLQIQSSVDEDLAILLVVCSGIYKPGSKGNDDGLYLFSKVVSNYFIYEPITLILDLRGLEYSWGNTILKTLNFFYETGRDEDEKGKLCTIIYSQQNSEAIHSVTKNLVAGNIKLCDTMEEALRLAVEFVEDYLTPEG